MSKEKYFPAAFIFTNEKLINDNAELQAVTIAADNYYEAIGKAEEWKKIMLKEYKKDSEYWRCDYCVNKSTHTMYEPKNCSYTILGGKITKNDI